MAQLRQNTYLKLLLCNEIGSPRARVFRLVHGVFKLLWFYKDVVAFVWLAPDGRGKVRLLHALKKRTDTTTGERREIAILLAGKKSAFTR